MAIEYTVYARIEAIDTETGECWEPDCPSSDVHGTTERNLFVTNNLKNADEFLSSLPVLDDDLEAGNG